MIKKTLKIFALIAIMTSFSANAQLTINDYCDLSVCTPASIKDLTALPDGETYASVNDEGTAIEIFSFKTGKKIKDLFNVNDIKGELRISDFDGFKISDNGKKILLWNNVKKIYRRSFTADYYVYDTFRSTLAKVSDEGNERGAVMSHDGRFVAFGRNNNIYIANLDYKTQIEVTTDGAPGKKIYGLPDWGYEEEFGIDNTIIWNNEDNLIAFMCFNEEKVPSYKFDEYSSYCNSDPMDHLYPENYSYKYPLAGFPCSVVSVLSYNIDNRVVKTMDLPIAEDDYIPSLEFDGKGKNLMVMILNHDQNALRLYTVNPASTVSRLLLTEESRTWLSPAAYGMLKYYENDFVIGSERSGWRHIYLYDYNGTLKKQITKGEFNITDFYGRDNAGTYYLQTTYLGAENRNLASVGIKSGFKLIDKNPGTAAAVFSSNFNYYIGSFSSSTVPPQYRLYNKEGKKLADLELNNEYAKKYENAPKMEFLKVKNDEGEDMNAFVIKPLNFDSNKKYTLLMYQYNGPDSQEVLNKWRMEGIFYLASQGYMVACVDGRGTGNRQESWAKCVYKNLGYLETKDQLTAASYFASLPYVDAERTACFGWSYGGYMTLMEMGNPDCHFKAGISMAGVADWRFYDAPYTERFMQTPLQNAEGYKNSSALNYTGNVKGRILLMTGANDDNVHMFNTLTYASKFSAEGGVLDMMVYPGYEHSLRMCDARVQLFRKIADFLNHNL